MLIAMIFVACGDDGEAIIEDNLTATQKDTIYLYPHDTYVIDLGFASPNNCKIKNSRPWFVSTVNLTNGVKVTANYVGTSTISMWYKGQKKEEVVCVKPHNEFHFPLFPFGTTKEEIVAELGGKFFSFDKYICYSYGVDFERIYYHFDDNKLILIQRTLYPSFSKVKPDVDERYEFLYEKEKEGMWIYTYNNEYYIAAGYNLSAIGTTLIYYAPTISALPIGSSS